MEKTLVNPTNKKEISTSRVIIYHEAMCPFCGEINRHHTLDGRNSGNYSKTCKHFTYFTTKVPNGDSGSILFTTTVDVKYNNLQKDDESNMTPTIPDTPPTSQQKKSNQEIIDLIAQQTKKHFWNRK